MGADQGIGEDRLAGTLDAVFSLGTPARRLYRGPGLGGLVPGAKLVRLPAYRHRPVGRGGIRIELGAHPKVQPAPDDEDRARGRIKVRRVWEVRKTVRAHALGETQRSEKLALGGRLPPGLPPGTSLAHARRAALNAGDCALTPEVRFTPPPPALGSGKLGTPRERMQSASLSAGVSPLPVAAPLLGPPEDPQASIATEDVITTNVISRL